MAEIDFKEANERYAANFGDKGKLRISPVKRLAVGKWHATAHDFS